MTPKLYGYARVSTEGQNLDMQIQALKRVPCDEIILEKASGGKRERPEFRKLIERAKPGDTIVVYKLDRFSRSARDLLNWVEYLEKKQVKLRSLSEHLDTSNAVGRMFLTMLSGFAQFERDTIVERVRGGLEAAKARGVRLGRQAKFTPDQIREVLQMQIEKDLTDQQVANYLKVDRATYYRYKKLVNTQETQNGGAREEAAKTG